MSFLKTSPRTHLPLRRLQTSPGTSWFIPLKGSTVNIFLSSGVIVSVGGQIPNCLAVPLYQQGVKILGTQPNSIDNAEDRFRFSRLLDQLNINQPRWQELTSISEALSFSREVGFPVLVRPSYVLSGNKIYPFFFTSQAYS